MSHIKIVSRERGSSWRLGTLKIRAFTLIELLVVLAIVALLATLAVPRYFQSIDTAKETILADNLHTTRETIDKFYGDTGRYPESLDELVEKKYLRALPFDPITESRTTWTIIAPDDAAKGNVYSIKSAAPGNDHNGKPFSEL
jgi:general secretion pathway protein G